MKISHHFSTFLAYFSAGINLFFRSCPPCPTCGLKYLTFLNLIGVPVIYQKIIYSYLKSPVLLALFFLLYILSIGSLYLQLRSKAIKQYLPIGINVVSFIGLTIIQKMTPDSSVKYVFLISMMVSFIYMQHILKKQPNRCCDHHTCKHD